MSTVKPIPDSEDSKKVQVENMFDSISGKYDFLNRFLSLGIDTIWRKKCVKELAKSQPKIILDMATGTGDLAIACLALKPNKIIGVDLSAGMLKKGEEKVKQKGLSDIIEFQKGDSENLNFDDNSFDAVTVAFGVRNFENLDKGLKELHRVTKPSGKIVVLEFSTPNNKLFRALYQFYFSAVLPLLGRLFSKSKRAYTYLPESVKAFPDGPNFTERLDQSGFTNTTYKPLTLGICSIYTGIK